MASPFSSKIWVIPAFLPISPIMNHFPRRATSVARMQGADRAAPADVSQDTSRTTRPRQRSRRASIVVLRLDLDVDARGDVQLLERFHGLRARARDVDQALVNSDLELLARLL